MADIRTLKLALLADTKQFIDGLDKADKETRSFSEKLGGALKAGALAFAALGAAAGAQARRQAHGLSARDQAPDEAGQRSRRGPAHAGGVAELWPHAHRAGGQGGLHRLHAKAPARLQSVVSLRQVPLCLRRVQRRGGRCDCETIRP